RHRPLAPGARGAQALHRGQLVRGDGGAPRLRHEDDRQRAAACEAEDPGTPEVARGPGLGSSNCAEWDAVRGLDAADFERCQGERGAKPKVRRLCERLESPPSTTANGSLCVRTVATRQTKRSPAPLLPQLL